MRRRTLKSCPTRRRGMTLLEVLVSLTIFMLSAAAILQLNRLSTQQAVAISLRGQAIQLCQSKMAEIYAGVEQLTSQSDVPFAEDSSWHWSADCNQGQVNNLWTVQVRVSKDVPGGKPIEVVLTQMMVDPSVRGTSMNVPTTTSTGPSGTTGNSSFSSSSSTGGS